MSRLPYIRIAASGSVFLLVYLPEVIGEVTRVVEIIHLQFLQVDFS